MTYPEDILIAAKKAAYAVEATGDGEAALTSFIGVRAVCSAILAERKRCAEIARTTYAKDAFHYELGTAVAERIESGQ